MLLRRFADWKHMGWKMHLGILRNNGKSRLKRLRGKVTDPNGRFDGENGGYVRAAHSVGQDGLRR